jgi:hypothetical protein
MKLTIGQLRTLVRESIDGSVSDLTVLEADGWSIIQTSPLIIKCEAFDSYASINEIGVNEFAWEVQRARKSDRGVEPTLADAIDAVSFAESGISFDD